MKYIIIKDYNGFEFPIIFSGAQSHDSFLSMYSEKDIVSAGFCNILTRGEDKYGQPNLKCYCFSESTSLNLKSRDEDDDILNSLLRE